MISCNHAILKAPDLTAARTFFPTIMPPKRPPPPLAVSLRAKRDAHPGNIDKNRTKRPNGSVQQDKDEKAAKRKASDAKKTASVTKAAAIELRMEVEAEDNDRNANHPPPKTTKKVLRPRPEPRIEDAGKFFLRPIN